MLSHHFSYLIPQQKKKGEIVERIKKRQNFSYSIAPLR
jgi:hypothetical protein